MVGMEAVRDYWTRQWAEIDSTCRAGRLRRAARTGRWRSMCHQRATSVATGDVLADGPRCPCVCLRRRGAGRQDGCGGALRARPRPAAPGRAPAATSAPWSCSPQCEQRTSASKWWPQVVCRNNTGTPSGPARCLSPQAVMAIRTAQSSEPLLGQHVLEALRALLVGAALDHALLDQPLEALGQHLRGDPEVGLQLVEAVDPDPDVAQDQRATMARRSTSIVRAIEHIMSPKRVRCMAADISLPLRKSLLLRSPP